MDKVLRALHKRFNEICTSLRYGIQILFIRSHDDLSLQLVQSSYCRTGVRFVTLLTILISAATHRTTMSSVQLSPRSIDRVPGEAGVPPNQSRAALLGVGLYLVIKLLPLNKTPQYHCGVIISMIYYSVYAEAASMQVGLVAMLRDV